MPKGTILGGFGGGAIVDRDESEVRRVPLTFPKGDKTVVIVTERATEDEDDGAVSKRGQNVTQSTIYKIGRKYEGLAAQTGKSLKWANFGNLEPVSEGTTHGYRFSCPESDEKHKL